MIVTKKSLGRRTMLRGMGTALALPFLDAMVPALSAASEKTCADGGSALDNSTSWRSGNQPLPHERNPRNVFERLFGEGGTQAERLQEMKTDRSILDAVLDDWKDLQHDIGPTDRLVVN